MARSPVSIIIRTSNLWDATRACLDSLPRTLGVRDQVIVVDDGSSDDTPAGLTRYPWVDVVRSGGKGAGGGDGFRQARHDFIVLLDPETMVSGHWLDPLVRVLERDLTVYAAGPCTNGSPGPQTADRAEYRGRGAMRSFAWDWCAAHRGQTSPADHLEGFCLALRRSVLDSVVASGIGPVAADVVHHLDGAGSALVICRDSYVHRSNHPSAPPLVSGCLITKDEEADIGGCLASLQTGFADEIVIYDTGSTDATVRIARALGATVIEGFWDDDFSRARNAALAHCRGEWIAWLDADETLVCNDIEALRQLLVHTKSEIDAWSVPISNLTGVGVGAQFTHSAARLFRREGQEWSGRLHEQIVRPGQAGGIRQAILETASLLHTGYLDQTWRAKDKSRRNLRIAAAGVEAAAGEDRGLSLLNLARSSFTAGLMEDSVRYCGEALEITNDPVIDRLALRTGAEVLVQLGRTDEALEWNTRLRARCANPVQADATEATIRLARGEFAAALECMDRIGPGGLDEDGFSHRPEQFAAPRAEALVGLGRHGEAVDVLLACLTQNASLSLHLGQLLEHLEAAGRPPAELAKVIPAAKAPYFLAQVLQLQPEAADAFLDACFAEIEDKTAVLATAATLARTLSVDRALVWSARLRAAGHGDACPLIAQATNAAGSAPVRAQAAMVAYRMFADDRARDALEAIAAGATDAERDAIRADTAALCPALIPMLDRPRRPVAPVGTVPAGSG